MKKVLSAVVFFAAAVCFGAVPPVPTTPVAIAHEASFRTEQKTTLDKSGCTATAIGPHALLTDTHCELGSDELYITNGVGEGTVSILAHIRDHNDHTIYLVDNEVPFRVFPPGAVNDPLAQGEDIFIWGNPGQLNDQFRKGYITGYVQDSNSPAALFGGEDVADRVVFDLHSWHGDSGAAIFNEAGEIVATVSTGLTQAKDECEGCPPDSITFTTGYALGFTKDQIARAVAFAPPAPTAKVLPPDEPTATGVPPVKK